VIPRNDVSIGNLTHVGMERTENQDYYGYYEPDDDREFDLRGRLIIVCDGMGGHAGGEVASRLAVNTLIETYKKGTDENVLESLRRAIEAANRAIWEEAQKRPELKGMGSTCVSIVLKKGMAYFGHVGDSRCYRLRGDEIKQLTTDHTLGAVGIRGKTEGVLSRAVGIEPHVEVDVTVDHPEVGDIYLLCSDGLSRMTTDDKILEAVRACGSNLDEAARSLIALANAGGGRDNVTTILIRVDAAPASQ